ncbi:MAG TPA: Clp protease N-terminal domain-containing protein [Promicromonospora sp.]|nr:Clp protease N-terminal domain-containing protein [Promicromonospora sp.]
MFEKFTTDARTAVTEALQVAMEAHSDQIDGRHLLAALAERPGPARDALAGAGLDPADVGARARASIATGEALDADVLAAVGVDLAEVERRTEASFGEGALARAGRMLRRRRRQIPFRHDARKALELALREAVRLGSREITGGHVLLGLTRDDSPARRLLLQAGADVDRVRRLAEGTPEAA